MFVEFIWKLLWASVHKPCWYLEIFSDFELGVLF